MDICSGLQPGQARGTPPQAVCWLLRMPPFPPKFSAETALALRAGSWRTSSLTGPRESTRAESTGAAPTTRTPALLSGSGAMKSSPIRADTKKRAAAAVAEEAGETRAAGAGMLGTAAGATATTAAAGGPAATAIGMSEVATAGETRRARRAS